MNEPTDEQLREWADDECTDVFAASATTRYHAERRRLATALLRERELRAAAERERDESREFWRNAFQAIIDKLGAETNFGIMPAIEKLQKAEAERDLALERLRRLIEALDGLLDGIASRPPTPPRSTDPYYSSQTKCHDFFIEKFNAARAALAFARGEGEK